MQGELSPTRVKLVIIEKLEKAFKKTNETFTIVGEIENYLDRRNESGWIFFTITDAESRIRCVVPPELANKLEFDFET